MSEKRLENVRIVRLPAMVVASYRAEGEAPEMDCLNVVNKLIQENNLQNQSGFRVFGFNNPAPSNDSPIYGYEIWVIIPEGLNVPQQFTKKKIESALYASIPTSMSEIGERYQQLYNWIQNNNEYEAETDFVWLEEIIDLESFMSAFSNPNIKQQLDILAPIKRK